MSTRDGDVRIVRKLKHMDGVTSYVCGLAVNDKYIFTGDTRGEAYSWDRRTGALIRTFEGGPGATINCLCITSDGKYLIGGASHGKMSLMWMIETGKVIQRFRGVDSGVEDICFVPVLNRVITAHDDDTAVLWKLDGSIVLKFKGHSGSVYAVCVSSDSSNLFTGSHDNSAMRWDMASGKMITKYAGHEQAVRSICLTNDDRYLITASVDETCIIWNAGDAAQLRTLKGHSDSICTVSVTSNGQLVVAGSNSGTVILWDFGTGKRLATLTDHENTVTRIRFSSDDMQLFTVAHDNYAIQYDISDILKNIPARYAHLHCLRSVVRETESGATRYGPLARSALRAYNTRDTSGVRYLLCCIARFL